jgi:hypothetical protein
VDRIRIIIPVERVNLLKEMNIDMYYMDEYRNLEILRL